MDERWIAMSKHFDKKLSKLDKKERSELLANLKNEFGFRPEPVEVLA